MLGLAVAIGGIVGFIALSYEVIWYRVVSLATWGRPSAFGLLLAAYLVGIALGSRGSSRFCKDDASRGDPRSLALLGKFLLAANLISLLVAPAFGLAATWGRLALMAAFVVVAIAAAMMGAILPMLCHFAIAPDDRAGQRLSYIYFANIVGSTLGSLMTGFVFLDTMTLAHTCLTLAVIGAVVGSWLFVYGSIGPARGRAVGTAAVMLVAVPLISPYVYDRLYERLNYRGSFTAQTFAEVVENKSGVITVTQDGTVFGGGAYDGRLNTSIIHDRNGIIRAYAIGALHPAPKQMLMIGLASGSWAQVIAHEPDLEHLTIVEINPGYLEVIAHHPDVAGLLKNPKVTIEIDDGRRWLKRNRDKRFDFIVMNATWHWRAHMTNLLSVDFMRIVRPHLLPGGIFYFNTTRELPLTKEDEGGDAAQKTAMTEFPYGLRFINFVAVSDSPFGLDKARFRELLSTYRIEGVPTIDMTTDEGKRTVDSLVTIADSIDQAPRDDGLERRESILRRTEAAGIVTDDNMLVEFGDTEKMFDAPVR